MFGAIHAVTRSKVNAQFDDAFTHRRRVTKIARLQLAQADANPSLRRFVAHLVQPFGDWLPSIFISVSENVERHGKCSFKDTFGCLNAFGFWPLDIYSVVVVTVLNVKVR